MNEQSLDRARPGTDRRWLILVVVAVAQLMIIVDASIVNVALPSAEKALHISTADRQWVVTAYTLTFGGLLLLGGRVADYVGRKRILLIGLIGFAGASALGGLAPDAALLFAARALQGSFAALLAPSALSLLNVTFTEAKERARAFGVYGAIAGGGLALGLVAGGVLTQFASWRWCLLVNVPIAILAAVAAARLVPESKAEGHTRYDIPGAITSTAGMVAIVYGFTLASTRGWSAPATLGVLAAGVLLLLAFVAVEMAQLPPSAPPTGHHRAQPGRFLPGHDVHRCGVDGDLPVPHLLPAADPPLFGPADRVRLPALLARDRHRCGRRHQRGRPGPPPGVDGDGADAGHRRDDVVHPHRRALGLLAAHRAARTAHGLRHGPGVRAGQQHRPHRRVGSRLRRGQRPHQHHPTGRWIDRHGAAQHRGRHRHRLLRPGHGPASVALGTVHGYSVAFTTGAGFLLLALAAVWSLVTVGRMHGGEVGAGR